jgi:hypothetical protein
MKSAKNTRSVAMYGVVMAIVLLAVTWTAVACEVATPGYWKNHPEAWPVQTITVGGVLYTQSQAIAIMKTPVRGDKTYTLLDALIAAKLNVLAGCDATPIASTITAADAWLAANPLGTGVSGSSAAWQDEGETLSETLDAYNNGLLGVPSRD